MKRLLATLTLVALCLGVFAATHSVADVPNVQRSDAARFTSNPDGILSYGTVARIDTLCRNLRNESLAEIAVVAVDDIEGGDVFGFAYELFTEWGVGDAGRDNGLLVLLVESEHEIRFVTGGGLEGVLPDALCKRIQTTYMLPAFREGDYDAGMAAGMDAVAAVLRGNAGELRFADEGAEDDEIYLMILLFAVVLPAIVIAAALLVIMMRRRCPACKRFKLRLVATGVVGRRAEYDVVERRFRCSHCGREVVRRARSYHDDYSGRGGGGTMIGGFGGGRSGGFGGGFGGGSSFGGGAGSKW